MSVEDRGCKCDIDVAMWKREGEVVEMVARQRFDFSCIQVSRWKGQNMICFQGPKLWIGLPEVIKYLPSLPSFKRAVKLILLN